jgi:hypothetical protein
MERSKLTDFNYVVLGAHRTGSTLVAKAMAEITNKLFIEVKPDGVVTQGILHTHTVNPKVLHKRANWILLICHRRDILAGIFSEIVARRSGEYQTYSNRPLKPKDTSLAEFINAFTYRHKFYADINRLGWYKVVDIYFEDVLQYPYYLCESIGIEEKIATPILTDVCPYRAKDIISNYDELETWWKEKGFAHLMSM